MGSMRFVEGDQSDDGSVLDAFVKLLVAEPEEKDRDGLDGLVRRSLRLRGWLDSIDARIAVRAARLAGGRRRRMRRRCWPGVGGGPGVTPRLPPSAARSVT